MNLDQLRYLLEVSKHKSLSAAAEKLHLTPQSLSKSIIMLEKELGFVIMKRNNHGYVFTPEGQELVKCAEQMLGLYTTTINRLQQQKSLTVKNNHALRGSLLIYSVRVYADTVLPTVIKKFSEDHPNVKISVLDSAHKDRALFLDDNAIMFFSIQCPNQINESVTLAQYRSEEYEFEPIVRHKYVAFVRSDSDLAMQKSISAKKLQEYPVVRYTNAGLGETSMLNEFISGTGRGSEDNICVSTNNLEIWKNAIYAGNVALISDIVNSHDSMMREAAKNFKRLKVRGDFHMLLCAKYSRTASKTVKEFLRYLPHCEIDG